MTYSYGQWHGDRISLYCASPAPIQAQFFSAAEPLTYPHFSVNIGWSLTGDQVGSFLLFLDWT